MDDDERPFRDLLSMALLMAAAPPPRDPGKPRTQHAVPPASAAIPGQKRT